MIRPAMFMCTVLLAVLAFAVYQVEYKVQDLRSELEQINDQIVSDREAMHVLKAEWSYLNKPERLRTIADMYLDVEKVAANKIIDIDNIPMRSENLAVLTSYEQ